MSYIDFGYLQPGNTIKPPNDISQQLTVWYGMTLIAIVLRLPPSQERSDPENGGVIEAKTHQTIYKNKFNFRVT